MIPTHELQSIVSKSDAILEGQPLDPVQILLNAAESDDVSVLNWTEVALWANDPNLAAFALECAAAEERQEAKRLMEVGA